MESQSNYTAAILFVWVCAWGGGRSPCINY